MPIIKSALVTSFEVCCFNPSGIQHCKLFIPFLDFSAISTFSLPFLNSPLEITFFSHFPPTALDKLTNFGSCLDGFDKVSILAGTKCHWF